MIVAEQKLFDSIICKEERFDEYRKYGIYVFRFFKNSLMYYVIIDDRIPVWMKENG